MDGDELRTFSIRVQDAEYGQFQYEWLTQIPVKRSESSLDARKNISAVVAESLQKAEEAVANLQKTHSRIVVTTLFSSGAATLIAGITAATGPSAEIGIEGWRTACILAAIFGFVSTVGSGLS